MSSLAERTMSVPHIAPDDELVSLTEAAKETCLSKQTLILARMKGELAMREAAGRFLIRRQDLDRYKRLRAQRSGQKSPRA